MENHNDALLTNDEVHEFFEFRKLIRAELFMKPLKNSTNCFKHETGNVPYLPKEKLSLTEQIEDEECTFHAFNRPIHETKSVADLPFVSQKDIEFSDSNLYRDSI